MTLHMSFMLTLHIVGPFPFWLDNNFYYYFVLEELL